MLSTIFIILLAGAAIVAFVLAGRFATKIVKKRSASPTEDTYGRTVEYDSDDDTFLKRIWTSVGSAAIVATLLLTALSSIFAQGVGEAKVIVDVSGKVISTKVEPGFGVKAPWQRVVDFDLFSQEVVYAGGTDTPPSYSGGTVSGGEVTVAVGGLNGGSTQANIDISVTYSLDADSAEAIYTQYKTQERFTKQVVEKTILSVIRQVPSVYSATEFRGEARQEAADTVLSLLNDKLADLGVTVDFVNLQDVRYPDNVEAALADVETANQAAATAEANLRAAEVKARQNVVEAQGVADANAILTKSLTPQILQQKYIDALNEGTIYVVPDGSTPFIGTR